MSYLDAFGLPLAAAGGKSGIGGMASSALGMIGNPALLPLTLGGSVLLGNKEEKEAEEEQKKAQEEAQRRAQLEAFAQNMRMLGQFLNQQNAGRRDAVMGALRR